MGFLSGFKNSIINSKDVNNDFGAKVVAMVKPLAEDSIRTEELGQRPAQGSIDSGFCTESFLNTLKEVINNGVGCAPSMDEKIAEKIVSMCKDTGRGKRYALSIIDTRGKLDGEVFKNCYDMYYAAKDIYTKEKEKSEKEQYCENDEKLVVTDEMCQEMSDKLNDKDILLGKTIKYVWERMPLSIKDIDNPIESISKYLKSIN